MRQRLLLVLALVLAPLAHAQDALEFLVDGRDKRRGAFAGRLTLAPTGQDQTLVTEDVVYRTGPEERSAPGRRQGNELRIEFAATPGLSGAVTGGPAPKPIRMRLRLSEEDTVLETTCKQGSTLVSEAYGQRVVSPLGATPARPEPDSPSKTYASFKGVPFIQGEGDPHDVAINDVNQGGLGDCYFMAGLAAVARMQPERVRGMVHENQDGSFTIYLWRHNDQFEEHQPGADGSYEYVRTATSVRLDDAFPAGFGGGSPAYADFGDKQVVGSETRYELWPMLLEKAYAALKGGYAKIDGGYASTPMSFFSSDEVIDHDPAEMTTDEIKAVLTEAEKNGQPVTMGVPEGSQQPSLNLYAPHYYAFWGFDADGNALFYNPWGSSHPPRGLTMDECKKIFDSIHVGPE